MGGASKGNTIMQRSNIFALIASVIGMIIFLPLTVHLGVTISVTPEPIAYDDTLAYVWLFLSAMGSLALLAVAVVVGFVTITMLSPGYDS